MNLLRSLFMGSWQPGQVPGTLRPALDAEGVLFLEEDLPGSASFLSYGRVGRPGPATRAVMCSHRGDPEAFRRLGRPSRVHRRGH